MIYSRGILHVDPKIVLQLYELKMVSSTQILGNYEELKEYDSSIRNILGEIRYAPEKKSNSKNKYMTTNDFKKFYNFVSSQTIKRLIRRSKDEFNCFEERGIISIDPVEIATYFKKNPKHPMIANKYDFWVTKNMKLQNLDLKVQQRLLTKEENHETS